MPERQCSAHKRNGDRCKNAAIRGGNVCGYHGGNAPAVKAKARLRLEMASDRLARQLLNMTSDPNVNDAVKLAAIKDALDRSGLAAKNAVSVELGITKPWESVLENISRIVAGPRDPGTTPALAIESGTDENEIDAEIIDPDDGDPSFGLDAMDVEIVNPDVDVEIMTDDPAPITPDDPDSSLSGTLSPGLLGLTGPVSSGLMPLSEAVAAQAEMMRRANLRNARRR